MYFQVNTYIKHKIKKLKLGNRQKRVRMSHFQICDLFPEVSLWLHIILLGYSFHSTLKNFIQHTFTQCLICDIFMKFMDM